MQDPENKTKINFPVRFDPDLHERFMAYVYEAGKGKAPKSRPSGSTVIQQLISEMLERVGDRAAKTDEPSGTPGTQETAIPEKSTINPEILAKIETVLDSVDENARWILTSAIENSFAMASVGMTADEIAAFKAARDNRAMGKKRSGPKTQIGKTDGDVSSRITKAG